MNAYVRRRFPYHQLELLADFPRTPILLLPLVMMLLAAGACARRLPPFAGVSLPAVIETREDVNELLFLNYGDFQSLRAAGEIQFRQLAEQNWRSASISLMIRRPDKARARAYRLLAPTLFDFVSDGDDCWLFLPSEQTVYVDDDCGMIESGKEYFVLSSRIIIAALLVVSDFDEFRRAPAFISYEDGMLRVMMNEEGDLQRELWIDRTTNLVRRQVFFSPGGTVEADLRYVEHTSVERSVVPAEVEVTLPQARAAMRLSLSEVKLDPQIPANAFLFSPPPNTRVIRLEDAPQQ